MSESDVFRCQTLMSKYGTRAEVLNLQIYQVNFIHLEEYHSSHYPQEALLAQFSLYMHKRCLNPQSFHFI